MYTIRTNCIVCNSPLDKDVLEKDRQVFVAHYQVESPDHDSQEIPMNISVCKVCNLPQMKYLANVNELYKINHADSTGVLMNALHDTTANIIMKYKEQINNIVEIGSAYGVLADKILSKMDTTYTIIEPSYQGTQHKNKVVIHKFYEKVDDTQIDANCMIISHVFEHFYNPHEILLKISNNPSLKYFILVFPDLEYYINHNVLHVLNTEHTFYMDNTFLKKWIESFGFKCIESCSFKNHSVHFVFERQENVVLTPFEGKNSNFSMDAFLNTIQNTITTFHHAIDAHPNYEVFVWPASIHTLTLIHHGLTTKITAFADSSIHKIGKYMYGYGIPIVSFPKLLQEDKPNRLLLLNGGVFHAEIEEQIQALKFTKCIHIKV